MYSVPEELLSQITFNLPPAYAVKNGSLAGVWLDAVENYGDAVSGIKKWLLKTNDFLCGNLGANIAVQTALENYLPFTDVQITNNFWIYRVNKTRGEVVKTGPHIDNTEYMVYIPYVVRPDLLMGAVASASAAGRNIWVIDSSADGLDTTAPWLNECTVLRLPYTTTFTQMHNTVMLRAANIGVPYLLFMHSDAALIDPDVIPELLACMRFDTAVAFTNYDALACFNTAAFRDIGFWDETFPQYAADCDYFYRVGLSSWRVLQTDLAARVAHLTSITVQTDPLRAKWNTGWVLAHYAHKWGGGPSNETFKLPYGLNF